MEIAPSAHRHDIDPADMLHAVDNAIDVFDIDDERSILIGAGRDGTLLEIGVRPGVIFHAMPARPKYLR